MKRSEYEQKMSDLQNQIEELKKVELEEDDKGWKPSLNEKYFYVASNGQIFREAWFDTDTDEARYAIGNYFKMEEEAEFMVEKLKVIAELRRFTSKEHWSTNKSQFELYVEHPDTDDGIQCELNINTWSYVQGSELRFDTERDAQNAINEVGEKRILKYYFEVAEEEL